MLPRVVEQILHPKQVKTTATGFSISINGSTSEKSSQNPSCWNQLSMVLTFCMFTGRFLQLGEDLLRNLINLRRSFEHCFCISGESSLRHSFEHCFCISGESSLRRSFEHCFCISGESSQAFVFETRKVPDGFELVCNPWFTTILGVSSVDPHLEFWKNYNNVQNCWCYFECPWICVFRSRTSNSQRLLAAVAATTPTVSKVPSVKTMLLPSPSSQKHQSTEGAMTNGIRSWLLYVGEPGSLKAWRIRYHSDLFKAQTPNLVLWSGLQTFKHACMCIYT